MLDNRALRVSESRLSADTGGHQAPHSHFGGSMRRLLMLVVASVTMVLVSAGSAWAQQYPPAAGAAGRGAGAGDQFAFTGSNTAPLLAIALALLVTGTVLVLTARRRSAVRSRSVSKATA